eukprot:TRINITY_DN1877_c0_g1_i1.p1 TRINITY_DN1877_c0_g1~~TRINITY_DN1877_c0_g1_i1.p1  ORF type:complete len:511 (+),score=86.30 TRINITY_DN1877_c0_g1_i1:835-2367(+)
MLIHRSKQCQLGSGLVIAVPISERDAADAALVENAIQQSLKEANDKKIEGRDVTPFLLARVNELTKGHSLTANIALIKQNAAVASQIAGELSRAVAASARAAGNTSPATCPYASSSNSPNSSASPKSGSACPHAHAGGGVSTNNCASSSVVLIGGVALDVSCRLPAGGVLHANTSNPGNITLVPGGVARNVLECLTRLDERPFFISAVGDDEAGRILRTHLSSLNISTDGIQITNAYNTAVYASNLDGKGELLHAVADMDIIAATLTPSVITKYEAQIKNARMVVIDANISADTLAQACRTAQKYNVPVWFIPISIAKCKVALQDRTLSRLITYVSPNLFEISTMADIIRSQQRQSNNSNSTPSDHAVARQHKHSVDSVRNDIQVLLSYGFVNVVVTMGAEGVMWGHGNTVTHVRLTAPAQVVRTTGAGDTFVGGTVWALTSSRPAEVSEEVSMVSAIAKGMAAAALTVQHDKPVSPLITPASVSRAQLTRDASVGGNTKNGNLWHLLLC